MLQSDDIREGRGRVRPMDRHDLAVVADMIVRLARHHGDDPAIDAARLEVDLFGETRWLHGLVVERFGYVVGYALLVPRYRAQLTLRGLDLHHLFVLEGSRGLGLGRLLVAGAQAAAREAGCAFLTVGARAENGRAQDFYRSLGFQPHQAAGQGFAMTL
ncbi:GNAT family N-acetyltransferase [Sphingobium sp. SYK-6]|uniref:GNAT family N-acetyltransferase n=1 Tax=Sphingobium sp. (strain NBRC 103272 / SYK-6) TaxID=627192 RepID=UPI001E599C4B|nr:GNAT family N-acetyltransferase [Sphingobium sp. SYK-6]